MSVWPVHPGFHVTDRRVRLYKLRLPLRSATGWRLRQQRSVVLSRFWRPGIRDQGVGGVGSPSGLSHVVDGCRLPGPSRTLPSVRVCPDLLVSTLAVLD